MTVYTWMVVLLLLAALLLNGNKKGNIKFILIAFLLIFAVLGLRNVNTAGVDSSGASGSSPLRSIGYNSPQSAGRPHSVFPVPT